MESAYAKDREVLLASLDDLKARVGANDSLADSNAITCCQVVRSSSQSLVHGDVNEVIKVLGSLSRQHSTSSNIEEEDSDSEEGQLREALACDLVTDSLNFASREHRHNDVEIAHEETFAWLFKPPKADMLWDSFEDWLQLGSGIYWVKGKAASGKSTLMKYILSQNKYKDHIHIWAGDAKLISASFYFYHLGTQIQRSQAGLLRSLLYRIFRKHKELIPVVLPDLYNTLMSRSRAFLKGLNATWHTWSLSELRTVLSKTVAQSSYKFCFLVDGLDEFDGDHTEIVTLFRKLSSHSNVKMCLSSRPLLIFEEALGNCPKLRLQDFTRNDIKRYSRDKLESHPHFQELSKLEPTEVQCLIDKILDRSSGVFLWVTLVVKSLLQGLANFDHVSDLMKRLEELPAELDQLFSRMIGSISPAFYVEQAARLFQLMYQSSSSLTASKLSFALEQGDTLALSPTESDFTDRRSLIRVKNIRNHVKSRSAGLLEVPTSWTTGVMAHHVSDPLIQYLHLTVKDYLAKSEIWSFLLEKTSKSDFDANLALARSGITVLNMISHRFGRAVCNETDDALKDQDYEAALRQLGTYEKLNQDRPFHTCFIGTSTSSKTCLQQKEQLGLMIQETMAYLRQAENSTGRAHVAMVDALDRVCARLISNRWYTDSMSLKGEDGIPKVAMQGPRNFLEYAAATGLKLYVDTRLQKLGGPHHLREASLLACATFSPVASIENCMPTIALLLQNGHNPNAFHDGTSSSTTVWGLVMEHVDMLFCSRKHNLHSRAGYALKASWLNLCKLFLVHGASLNLEVKFKGERAKPSTLTVSEFLRQRFSDLPRASVEELQDIIRRASIGNNSVAHSTGRKRKRDRKTSQAYDSYRPSEAKRFKR
jgi:hypothetical protein